MKINIAERLANIINIVEDSTINAEVITCPNSVHDHGAGFKHRLSSHNQADRILQKTKYPLPTCIDYCMMMM